MPDDDGELARLMPDVAQRVLGKPNRALLGGREWRWGRKGSLVVKPLLGVYTNFETAKAAGSCTWSATPWASDPREAGEWLRARAFGERPAERSDL